MCAFSHRRWWWGALLAGIPVLLTAADGAAEKDRKNFVVYLGLRVAVAEGGKEFPVTAGDGSHLSIQRDGELDRVAARDARLKTLVVPKVSRDQVMLEDLKGTRTYSRRNNPNKSALSQQMIMASAQNQPLTEPGQYEDRALVDFVQALGRNALIDNPASADERREEPRDPKTPPRKVAPGDDGLDAFEVSFRISAPRSVSNACGAVRLVVREPGSPQQLSSIVRYFALRQLGPEPRKVTVLQSGLASGFSVESYDVHIFTAGRELATNLSRNRVELSEDEAHQFFILGHLQEHPGASLPPRVIPDMLPQDLGALVSAELLNATAEFAIDRNGRVTNVEPSGGAATSLRDELAAALRQVRFLPAIKQGAAVDSSGTFALSELFP